MLLCFEIVFDWIGVAMFIVVLIVLFMCHIYPSLAFWWVFCGVCVGCSDTLVCCLVLLMVCTDLFWVTVILSLVLLWYCAICVVFTFGGW